MSRRGGGLRTYVLTRVLLAIPTVFILVTMVFLLMRVAPGDPITAALGARLPAKELEKRKITLVSIREGVDLSSAVGQAVLGVMASFAQMERKLILERQAAGIEAAKSRGQKFGRPTKIGAKEAGEIVMRRAMGVPIATIAKQLNLSRSAIYRHLEKVDAVAPE